MLFHTVLFYFIFCYSPTFYPIRAHLYTQGGSSEHTALATAPGEKQLRCKRNTIYYPKPSRPPLTSVLERDDVSELLLSGMFMIGAAGGVFHSLDCGYICSPDPVDRRVRRLAYQVRPESFGGGASPSHGS